MVPLLAGLGTVMVVGPIVFYPFSKTIWVAVDRTVLHRLDPHERFERRTVSARSRPSGPRR